MITQLKLTNVQKHTDLTVNLSEGITVIYGETESGKTSAFRGLVWALTNNETGEVIVNNKAKPSRCEVEVTIDGHTITRKWGTKLNSYELDGEEYKSFKTNVPAPIAELVNLSPVAIQSRRDLPFMVYHKASENATQFSEMLDIMEIQRTITNANAQVKAAEKTLAVAEDRFNTTVATVDRLKPITEAVVEYKRINQMRTEAEETIVRTAGLENQVKLYIYATGKVSELSAVNKAVKAFETVESTVKASNAASVALRNVMGLAGQLSTSLNTCERYKVIPSALETVTELERIEQEATKNGSAILRTSRLIDKLQGTLKDVSRYGIVNEAITDLDNIREAVQEHKRLFLKIAEIERTVATIATKTSSADIYADSVSELEAKLQELVGTTCPTCGNTIKELS